MSVGQFFRLFSRLDELAVNHIGIVLFSQGNHFFGRIQRKNVVAVQHPDVFSFRRSDSLVDSDADASVFGIFKDFDVRDSFSHLLNYLNRPVFGNVITKNKLGIFQSGLVQQGFQDRRQVPFLVVNGHYKRHVNIAHTIFLTQLW